MSGIAPSRGCVVITGVSSFIGCHLARRFAADGWRVIATHSLPVERYDGIRRRRLDAIKDEVQFAALNLTDERAIDALVDRYAPELWLQHAGFAENYASPDFDVPRALAINVAPLYRLYRRLAGTGTGVIVTGSSMEYTNSDQPNRETDPCWPATAYGMSKLAESVAARQLSALHDVPTRIARVYIPFGAFDDPRKLLPQVVAALRRRRPVDLSPCLQRRDFVSILDLVEGYGALARDLVHGGCEVFNICGGEPTELRAFLLAIAARLEADAALLRFGARPMNPAEPPISFGSSEQARRRLGWTPSPLDETVRRDLLTADFS
ncbi:MAG TPA: NAD(P)-dependent oxidoreductase [Stellaceae bacterium]|nr:NAD(P)-dependent oxidoreductase [Stellaceae bacterium]